jgi:hypothetical protein
MSCGCARFTVANYWNFSGTKSLHRAVVDSPGEWSRRLDLTGLLGSVPLGV